MLARLALVLLGLVTGFAGALVHRHDAEVSGFGVPWGLFLALWTTAAVAWGSSTLVRVGAAWFGLGWTLMVLLQQSVRPGSLLVAGDAVGWTFMGAGLALVAGVVVLHPVGGVRRTDQGPTSLER
ncbi:hypothetical protein [Aeromicrobium sp. CTD01-1L150]|uniref:hypothetical protein n=1 Tax=Aeromicrobium sp. CTD01-1L150 TaxID=3341830 RepID=UPI0035BF2057